MIINFINDNRFRILYDPLGSYIRILEWFRTLHIPLELKLRILCTGRLPQVSCSDLRDLDILNILHDLLLKFKIMLSEIIGSVKSCGLLHDMHDLGRNNLQVYVGFHKQNLAGLCEIAMLFTKPH